MRFGDAFNHTMVYITGGYTGANLKGSVTDYAPRRISTPTNSTFLNGWTIGGGIEFALTHNVSVRRNIFIAITAAAISSTGRSTASTPASASRPCAPASIITSKTPPTKRRNRPAVEAVTRVAAKAGTSAARRRARRQARDACPARHPRNANRDSRARRKSDMGDVAPRTVAPRPKRRGRLLLLGLAIHPRLR